MHPAGVFPQKYNGRPVNDAIVRSIVAFVLGYFAIIICSAALLGLLNIPPADAISGAMTAVKQRGLGMGQRSIHPVIMPRYRMRQNGS